MGSSGMPSVGCDIGIFVGPRDKSEHRDHLLLFRVFHAGHEDFAKRPEVGAGCLAGVVHRCLILPDIEVQNRPAIGNEEVEVVERVVFQRRRLPAFQPESIDIIPEHARVRLARLDEIFQQPDVGVVLRAAGGLAVCAGDASFAGEKRAATIGQQAAHDFERSIAGGQLAVERALVFVESDRQQVLHPGHRGRHIGRGRHPFIPDHKTFERV